MERSELEKKVFDIECGNVEDKEELLERIKNTSTDDLEFFFEEYNAYLDFISAVESLKLPD